MSVQGTNQWMLFGVDVRSLGQLWLGAWRDLLFSYRSPLRVRFDEPVWLRKADGDQWFQGGSPSGDAGGPVDGSVGATLTPVAVELPDALALSRRVTLPVSAEAQLSSVLDLEVAAASPFPGDDSVFGWEEISRDAQSLAGVLVIGSRAGIIDWLRQSAVDGARDPDFVPEVWADFEGVKVCIRGFGEDLREKFYRRRLLRIATIAGAVLVLGLLVASLFSLQQRVALGKLQALEAQLQRDAAEVSAARESLASANEAIRLSNDIVAQYPNPHLELARLTRMLDDNAFLTHFSMRGRELRIRGRAAGAASIMQTLAQAERYAVVTAPQAITAVGDTGLEQFHLDIDLAAPDAVHGGDDR